MAKVRAHVMLPEELIEQMDEIVGRRQRSQFIEDAVAQALRKARLTRALRAIAEAPPAPGPPEWDDPDAWIAEIRKDRRDPWAEAGGHPD